MFTSSKIVLGIDAINIRDGGGLTHLREILANVDDASPLFDNVIVWGNDICLEALPNKHWLTKIQPLHKGAGIIQRTYWQVFQLAAAARLKGCSLLFIAGGSSFTSFKPYVTICHNMLPFTEQALQQYGFSLRRCKFVLLRMIQLHTFKNAKGIIFLSNWAMQQLRPMIKKFDLQYTEIPHGINPAFKVAKRVHRSMADCTIANSFTIVYVSRIEPYKNQLTVIQYLFELRAKTGWPLRLVLAGMASDQSYYQQMHQLIEKCNEHENWINYMGVVPYEKLSEVYVTADMAVFASTCENMPIILLEKMAAGLPIVCSHNAPMPDFLKDAGLYASIDDPTAFQSTMQQLIENRELRISLSEKVSEYAANYQWSKASTDTFQFLYSYQ